MNSSIQLKPLLWVGSTRKDLKKCPSEVQHVMGFALRQAQEGQKHVNAKPLKGFGGAGVLEVVEDHDGNTYRSVYTVRFAGVVYVLHVFQKKSKKGSKTPKPEVDLIKQRLKATKDDYEKQHNAHEET